MRFEPQATRDLIAVFHPAGSPPRAARRLPPAMRLLEAVMRLAGPLAQLISHAERPWASATFQGSRHTIALAFPGIAGIAAAETFLEALPEHEFTIPRQLVADAAASEVTQEMFPSPRMLVAVELLVLEEG